jgi:hypothetical protein
VTYKPLDNPDNVPTFGFVKHSFNPKRRCEACNRSVYVGIVNINDMAGKVVCMKCSDTWDEGPTSFENSMVGDLDG